MRRVCLVGNSHLASLKGGWDAAAPQFPDLEVTCFGAGSTLMRNIEPGEGRLQASAGTLRDRLQALWGASELDLAPFDAIFLIGMGTSIAHLQPAYTSLRTVDFAENERLGERPLVSRTLFNEAAYAAAQATVCYDVLTAVRKATDKPIHLCQQPAPLAADKGWTVIAEETGEAADLADIWLKTLRRLPVESVLPQAEDTLAAPLATKAEFGAGSVRLRSGVAHAANDSIHMNSAYGRRVIEQIAATLAA